DPGHSRIGPEMRQRQTGAHADFKNPLSRPIIGDAYGVLAPRVEYGAKDNIVRSGEQAVSPDRIVQLHRFTFIVIDRTGAEGHRVVSGAGWFRPRWLS